MEGIQLSITPSEVIEYMYCPRFIYYMLYLKIPQYEDKDYKVQLGREVHEQKADRNRDYLRKKLAVKDKIIEQKLSSEKYQMHGIVDEILILKDGTAAPLDYKFAKYKGRVFKTYKSQIIMYAMLIEENLNLKVNKGYLVYTRSRNKLVTVEIKEEDKTKVLETIDEIVRILNKGYYPEGTSYKKRCFNCCYRNICVK